MANKSLIYDVEDRPKFSKLLIFAFQQLLAVLAATIAVPTIIGMSVDIPAAILGGGIGTIVYLLFTKFKSPVVISSSFAFLGALSNAVAFGYMGIALGGLFAGLVYVVIAIVVHFTGTGWVNKLLPAVIIGPTVALIGLSLASSAMGDIVKSNGSQVLTSVIGQYVDATTGETCQVTSTLRDNQSYNLVALLCGLITFFTVVICSVQNRRKGLRLLPFITGIGVGYIVATIFSLIGYGCNVDYLKIIDWSALTSKFQTVTINSFFEVPHISLVEGIKELTTGQVSATILAANKYATPITWAGVAEVALAFIPVALVTYAEHIADHTNLGYIIGRDLLNDQPGMTRTLLGDGVGSIIGTFFGICPNTTYGESVGCVAITKNASVITIFTTAIMLIILSFLAPVTGLLRTIPSCVMGGVCLTLYGFIAVSGLKMFKEVDFNNNKNLFTVAAIFIAGIGGLAIKIPYQIDGNGQVAKTIQITSIATALLLGIATYFICSKIEKHNLPEEEEEGK